MRIKGFFRIVLLLAFASTANAAEFFVTCLNSQNGNSVWRFDDTGKATPYVTGIPLPTGIALDQQTNLYVASLSGNNITKITPEGVRSIFASGLAGPWGIAFSPSGDLYVANNANFSISRISPDGIVSPFVTIPTHPGALAFDAAGNLYTPSSTTIRKITPSGVQSIFANGFQNVSSLAFDSTGILYVNSAGNSHSISKVNQAGVVSPFVPPSTSWSSYGLAFAPNGDLYVADGFNRIDRVRPNGQWDVVVPYAPGLDTPVCLVALPEPIPPLTIRCADPLLLECTNGFAVGTLQVTVVDLTGSPLEVIWQVDGQPYQTNHIPSDGTFTSTNVAFTANFAQGTHTISVSVSNGQSAPETCTTTVNARPQESVVWDFGPTTGLRTYGFFGNYLGQQEFVDTVTFPSATNIIGFNLFTDPQVLPPRGNQYRVTFYSNSPSGVPGTVYAEQIVSAVSTQFVGNFLTPVGNLAPVHQLKLRFNPVQLQPGTTYWVGASSIGFDIGQLGVIAPGDGSIGQLHRALGVYTGFRASVQQIGNDQMFQLVAEYTPPPPPPGPPTINCSAPLLLECTNGTAAATLHAQVTDTNGLPLQVVWTVDGTSVQTNDIPSGVTITQSDVTLSAIFGTGQHTIIASVSNGATPPVSCSTTTTVLDTTPPQIANLQASPNSLWPPNHRMVPIQLITAATDGCDSSPVISIAQVTSNEPVNGEPDWEITGPQTLNLRADRLGKGKGRIYTITVRCQDASGNISFAPVTVTVPHN